MFFNGQALGFTFYICNSATLQLSLAHRHCMVLFPGYISDKRSLFWKGTNHLNAIISCRFTSKPPRLSVYKDLRNTAYLFTTFSRYLVCSSALKRSILELALEERVE